MVRHAGSPICTAHADVTLAWSKVKVKVTDSQFPQNALFYFYLLLHFGTKLKTDGWLQQYET